MVINAKGNKVWKEVRKCLGGGVCVCDFKHRKGRCHREGGIGVKN